MSLTSYQIWSWVTLDWTWYNIKWRSFNPKLNITDWGTSSIIWNIPNWWNISLSWFQFWHEVIVALWQWDDDNQHYIEFRKGITSLFIFFWSFYEFYAYIWIDYDEIMSNWTDYYVDFWLYLSWTNYGWISYVWSNSFSYNIDIWNIWQQIEIDYTTDFWVTHTIINWIITSKNWSYIYSYAWPSLPSNITNMNITPITKTLQWTLNYTITDFPSIIWPVESWKIWVEWNNLCFTDAVKWTTWYKHIIKNNWIIYSTWKTPWMFRIDSSYIWALWYIDEYWNERKTHLWDIYWSPWNNEPWISWLTPWMIRVSAPEWNYWYLTFIWPNWARYRIMNWDI